MESFYKRWQRYCKYMLEWLFAEKLHGLDFTMRKLNNKRTGSGTYNGYSKTDSKHIKEIFNRFCITNDDKILDIGCGKGAVLRELTAYDFGVIDGIEYDKELVDIAKRNFDRLKLSGRVNVIHEDAMEFTGYGNYNFFYFFNSFSGGILRNVFENILNSVDTGWFIYHNPVNSELVESMDGFVREYELFDKVKSYSTYIYRIDKTVKKDGKVE